MMTLMTFNPIPRRKMMERFYLSLRVYPLYTGHCASFLFHFALKRSGHFPLERGSSQLELPRVSLKQAIICRPFSCAKALRGVCTTAARGLAFMQIQPRSRAKGELLCLRRQRKAHIQGKGDRWMDGGRPLASSPVVAFQASPFEQHYLRGGKKAQNLKGQKR